MSAEYKVTKGIYTRKYQAKNIWDVSGACVEKQRIQRNFAMCLNPPCEIFARGVFMVRSGQISHHEENLLAKWCSHGLIQLSSEGHIFLISAPHHTRFEALDS